MIRRLRAEMRHLLAVAWWLVESAGYWIRPYDMLADRRRWRWQPAQRCGFGIQCYHRYPCPNQPTPPDAQEH